MIKQLALALVLGAGCVWHSPAQSYYDDDIYYNASKAKKEKQEAAKKAAEEKVKANYVANESVDFPGADTYTVNSGSQRDVDEYNRRTKSTKSDITTLSDSVENGTFAYTRRIEKFYNPTIIENSGDETLQYLYYTAEAEREQKEDLTQVNIYVNSPWGWYDSWPYYSSYAWGPLWSWNSWNYWYGPSWSWYWNFGPISWGWGPTWGWGPSWSWGGPAWGRPGMPAPPRPGGPAWGAGRPNLPGSTGGMTSHRPSNPNPPARYNTSSVRRNSIIRNTANANGNFRPGNTGNNGINNGNNRTPQRYTTTRPTNTNSNTNTRFNTGNSNRNTGSFNSGSRGGGSTTTNRSTGGNSGGGGRGGRH